MHVNNGAAYRTCCSSRGPTWTVRLPGLRSQRVLADVRDLASAAEPFRGRSDVDDLVRDLTAVTG